MKNFLNKQRAALAAFPVALFGFVVIVIIVSSVVTMLLRTTLSERDDSNVILPSPQRIIAPEGTFPPISYIPLRNDDAQNLEVTTAHAAIVLDVNSGTILYEKNSTEHRSIASITKMLTAMIVIDRVQNLDEYVRVPPELYKIEGTRVGCITSARCDGPQLLEGTEVRVRDLLSAMLVASANDAATLLGYHIAGSEEDFAQLMNLRVKELGLTDSVFCRPSGLEVDIDTEKCYSSAYDIARIIGYLFATEKYSVLWDILREQEKTFPTRDGTIVHEISTTNRILEDYDYIIGGKTGFTPRSGYSLALAARVPDEDYIIVSVVLDDPERFTDVQVMSEWAFTNFAWY